VKAGHFHDPPGRAGLAHFHEHMLFLGTHAYPEEGAFEKYLTGAGGRANAYTDMEDTNYYFHVTPPPGEDRGEALSGALRRFSRFFVDPSFDPSAIGREVKAVDSEYNMGLGDDSWRQFQLMKTTSNPMHPFRKMGCGNAETLTRNGANDPRPDLVRFWNDKYHAENMRVAVVGRGSLDELQAAVEETFSDLRRNSGEGRLQGDSGSDAELFATAEPPVGAAFPTWNTKYDGAAAFRQGVELGIIREVLPVKDVRQLSVAFAAPPATDPRVMAGQPVKVLSHVLGHEAPESLHSVLSEAGLVAGLSSGAGIGTSDFSFFTVTLSLTENGMKRRDDVMLLLFQYIGLIRSLAKGDGAERLEQFHDELRQISDINFNFSEGSNPTSFVQSVSKRMFEHAAPDLLPGSNSMGKHDRDALVDYLSLMTPANAIITVIDQALEGEGDDGPATSARRAEWAKEKWYGAPYREVRTPEGLAALWADPPGPEGGLTVPGPNKFVPSDFSLRCDADGGGPEAAEAEVAEAADTSKVPPEVLADEPAFRLWHKMDTKYRIPKTTAFVQLVSPKVYESPRSMVLCRIFREVLGDELNSYLYDSTLIGLGCSVSFDQTGIRLTFQGFSEKIPLLLDVVTERMITLVSEMEEGPDAHPSLARKFEKHRLQILRASKNSLLGKPYTVANYYSKVLLEDGAWHVDRYVDELEDGGLTLAECGGTVRRILEGRVAAETLCMGNVDAEGARQIGEIVEERFVRRALPLSDAERPNFKSFVLPTEEEARRIYGDGCRYPLALEEVAAGAQEDNNAVEFMLQMGCDHTLQLSGTAILILLGHLGQSSAFEQLRTKEQLGYIVGVGSRRTAGRGQGMSVVVQSSTHAPEQLQERIEAWLVQFREELENMTEDRIQDEASSIVAMLSKRDVKQSDEINRFWGVISGTVSDTDALRQRPVFDRIEKVADELRIGAGGSDDRDDRSPETGKNTAADIKNKLLVFFDRFVAAGAPERRGIYTCIYGRSSMDLQKVNVGTPGVLSSNEDVRHLKSFMSTWPTAPMK